MVRLSSKSKRVFILVLNGQDVELRDSSSTVVPNGVRKITDVSSGNTFTLNHLDRQRETYL